MQDDHNVPNWDSDLVAYYDSEVRARAETELPRPRIVHRTAFTDLVKVRRSGHCLGDRIGAWARWSGVRGCGAGVHRCDPSPVAVAYCRSLGLQAAVGSVLHLPFRRASFDAGWTMSTLLHIGDDFLDHALREIARVLRPGAPVVIGLWGNRTGHERA